MARKTREESPPVMELHNEADGTRKIAGTPSARQYVEDARRRNELHSRCDRDADGLFGQPTNSGEDENGPEETSDDGPEHRRKRPHGPQKEPVVRSEFVARVLSHV